MTHAQNNFTVLRDLSPMTPLAAGFKKQTCSNRSLAFHFTSPPLREGKLLCPLEVVPSSTFLTMTASLDAMRSKLSTFLLIIVFFNVFGF
jgi:hypothetical protein